MELDISKMTIELLKTYLNDRNIPYSDIKQPRSKNILDFILHIVKGDNKRERLYLRNIVRLSTLIEVLNYDGPCYIMFSLNPDEADMLLLESVINILNIADDFYYTQLYIMPKNLTQILCHTSNYELMIYE